MILGIVGLGLIGGSLAAAAAERTGHAVLGLDRDPAAEQAALERGWIHGRLEGRLGECDLLILAVYPRAAVEFLEQRGTELRRDALVLDTCGVKRVVTGPLRELARRQGYTYLGAHPMAGREFSGLAYAQSNLFDGASLIVTPEEDTPDWALERIEGLAAQLGFARVTRATDLKHDQVIAYTSQLAHVLSNAYVKSPQALRHSGFSAGSFQDLTRVARLNETMWTELFLENRDCLKEELDRLIENLRAYSDALAASDAETLKRLLREGREMKERTEKL